jgi:hypothetical protein
MNLRCFQFFPLLFASTIGFCVDQKNLDNRISQLESDMAMIHRQTALGNYGAKTAVASPQIDGCGVVVTADFLWWKLYEGGTEYVFKNTVPVTLNHIQGPLKHHQFKWEPGYKVGLGYLFDFDGWDTYIEFTSFNTHSHRSTFSHVQGLLPLMGLQTALFSHAHSSWKVDFRDIDFTFGRNYFVSRYLALHPSFGVTSAWITQHRHSHYTQGVTINDLKLRSKNNFWGIGPRLETEIRFYLGRHYSVYGNLAGALLWGHFHVKEREEEIAGTVSDELYNLRDNLHRMVPTVGFGLGAAFETHFARDACHFMIKIGYEGQYWWRQNQLPIFNSFATDFSRQSEDLSLQGLTIDLTLDF